MPRMMVVRFTKRELKYAFEEMDLVSAAPNTEIWFQIQCFYVVDCAVTAVSGQDRSNNTRSFREVVGTAGRIQVSSAAWADQGTFRRM
eukprot:SAG31_NODE_7969_length_1552_cov_1.327598_2_plen_88_part_00